MQHLEPGRNFCKVGMLCAYGVTAISLGSSTLYPMLRPMSPELKVKERNTAVLKYRLSVPGFKEEGKGRRMRWGFG